MSSSHPTFKALLTTLLLATTTTTTTTTAAPLTKRNLGGVRLCDQANWGGNCWYGIVPLNTCMALNNFKSKVLSFRPDEGTECFLMQGRCTANEQFISLNHGDTDVGSDLTGLEWIGDVESFTCSRQIGEDGDEVVV